MNARGSASKELVEPKLAELNRNFEKVSQHIQSAKVSNYVFIENRFVPMAICLNHYQLYSVALKRLISK